MKLPTHREITHNQLTALLFLEPIVKKCILMTVCIYFAIHK